MARFKDPGPVYAAFNPHLRAGERVLYTAYGVKQPNIFIIMLLGGGLLLWLLTKEYVVALTDHGRFLVLRFTGKLNVKEVLEYYLGNVEGVSVKTGAIFTRIGIKDPQRPFAAKFHRLGTSWNRPHSIAIAQSLERRQIMALPPA